METHSRQFRALRKLLHHGAREAVRRALAKLSPADVAELLPKLSFHEKRRLAGVLLASSQTTDELRRFAAGEIDGLLEAALPERISQFTARLSNDDALELLKRLPANKLRTVLPTLAEPARSSLERRLRYPPDCAGALMSTTALSMPATASCDDAIAKIRQLGAQRDTPFYLYVVDDDEALRGVVSMRQLVVSPRDSTLGELMTPQPIQLDSLAPAQRVARLASRYDLLALPIVDEQHRLLGTVAVDDVIDFVQAEATKDFHQMTGLDQTDPVFGPLIPSVRRRVSWTMINVMTAVAASLVVSQFHQTIAKMVVLAAYMPIVAGLGGNSGSQALTIIIRSLALGELEPGRGLRAALRQLAIGLIVGVLAGTVAGTAAYLLEADPMLGVVLLFAMTANMAMGAIVGATIPFLLKRLRLDPALGSGILVTGLTDSFGFLVFLGLGSLILLP